MVVVLVVLGVVCAAYGAVVLSVGSGTGFFLFWWVLAALLLASAWAAHAGWIAALPQVARRAIAVVLALALAGFLAACACVARDFNARPSADVDYLVVLGAQVRADGPSAVFRFRLDTAAEYLQDNPRTRVVVTGGQGPNELRSEGDAGADYLIARGIAPERILVERESTSTRGNLEGAFALIDPQRHSVAVVTNNFHVFRGVGLARKLGAAEAYGLAAPSTALYLPNNVVRETLGIAKDALAGNL